MQYSTNRNVLSDLLFQSNFFKHASPRIGPFIPVIANSCSPSDSQYAYSQFRHLHLRYKCLYGRYWRVLRVEVYVRAVVGLAFVWQFGPSFCRRSVRKLEDLKH